MVLTMKDYSMRLILSLLACLLCGGCRICSLAGCQVDDLIKRSLPAPVNWPNCDPAYSVPTNGTCQEKHGGLLD